MFVLAENQRLKFKITFPLFLSINQRNNKKFLNKNYCYIKSFFGCQFILCLHSTGKYDLKLFSV